MTDHAAIHVDQHYDAPASAVWRAITDPDLLAQWWAPGDIRPIVGHTFALDMGNWGSQPCEVLAVEEERLLTIAFSTNLLHTTITWALTPDDTGTQLAFTHDGFDRSTPFGKTAYEGMGAGWPSVLARLATILPTPVAE